MSTFLERVKSFASSLTNYVQTGGQLVDQNTANIRAEICAACHNNKPDAEARKSCCGKGLVEGAAILAIRTTIVGSRTTTSHSKLGSCGICGCVNNLQVWFPSNPLGMNEENANAYPSFCWKKQIINF